MPCLFSYNGITKQDGRAATLPLSSVSPTFRSHSLPIFFLICFRRTAYRQDAPFFFFSFVRIFAKGKYRPKTRPISEKRCRLLFTYARAGGISALQNGKARRVSFRYIPFFAFTQRRGRRSFCRHAAQLRRLFSKPTERFKKTVRRLQTGRRRSTTYPQTARLTI